MSVPEGDTIARAARTLQQWLGGRDVTRAWARNGAHDVGRLVGARVERVEGRGKHLLMRFDDGSILRTHMRMTGSWHVYPAGTAWRKPRGAARIVIEAGDRHAVGFDIPVIEIDRAVRIERSPVIAGLGPDILAEPLDRRGIVARARDRDARTALGEILLDQQVVAGIGNIWRCEALYAAQQHPWTALGDITDAQLGEVIGHAATFMQASVREQERPPPAVYGRSGRPCRRCLSTIRSRPQGRAARMAYWCARCQPLIVPYPWG